MRRSSCKNIFYEKPNTRLLSRTDLFNDITKRTLSNIPVITPLLTFYPNNSKLINMDQLTETEEQLELVSEWIGEPVLAYSMARIASPATKYAWVLFCVGSDALYLRFFDGRPITQALINAAPGNEGPLVRLPYQEILSVDFTPQKKILGFILLQEGLININFVNPVAVPPDAQTKNLVIEPLSPVGWLQTHIEAARDTLLLPRGNDTIH
jgi:hypothetical protein